jgi:lactate dehydrogenase-like 2-hydroxyacid dehydrogenase
VDLEEAGRHQVRVANVPEYSPYAIAEFAVAMLLGNRYTVKISLSII